MHYIVEKLSQSKISCANWVSEQQTRKTAPTLYSRQDMQFLTSADVFNSSGGKFTYLAFSEEVWSQIISALNDESYTRRSQLAYNLVLFIFSYSGPAKGAGNTQISAHYDPNQKINLQVPDSARKAFVKAIEGLCPSRSKGLTKDFIKVLKLNCFLHSFYGENNLDPDTLSARLTKLDKRLFAAADISYTSFSVPFVSTSEQALFSNRHTNHAIVALGQILSLSQFWALDWTGWKNIQAFVDSMVAEGQLDLATVSAEVKATANFKSIGERTLAKLVPAPESAQLDQFIRSITIDKLKQVQLFAAQVDVARVNQEFVQVMTNRASNASSVYSYLKRSLKPNSYRLQDPTVRTLFEWFDQGAELVSLLAADPEHSELANFAKFLLLEKASGGKFGIEGGNRDAYKEKCVGFDDYWRDHLLESILVGSKTVDVVSEVFGESATKENSPVSEFHKIGALFYFVNQAICHNDFSFDIAAKVQEAIKGWFDLSKYLPPRLQWVLIKHRTLKEDLTYAGMKAHVCASLSAFNSVYPSIDWSYEPNLFYSYSPYDARGGFSFNTYISLCEKYGVDWKKQSHFSNDMTDFYVPDDDDDDDDTGKPFHVYFADQGALSLAYLYGSDKEAAHKYVDQKKAELGLTDIQALQIAGDFRIPAMTVDSIKLWRPLLTKYPRVLRVMKLARDFEKLEVPDTSDSEQAVLAKVLKGIYQEVTPETVIPLIHAAENNWSQETVNHLLDLLPSAKKESMIPEVSFTENGVKVYCLKPGDPTALYVGELSGCCQHINDGGGDDAAIQSFTEKWCSVLMIESASSGKLLAQSFIWMDEDEKTVVMDSVESVLDCNNSSVSNLVVPAIVEWAKKLKEHKLKVAVSDASYGLTTRVCNELHKSDKYPDLEVVSIDAPTPYDELEYSDVGSEVYLIKLKKTK